MKSLAKFISLCFLCLAFIFYAQGQEQDSMQVYKKRVLENVEIDFLSSSYLQDGDNAAVTGGIGSENLLNGAGAITISIPLNSDDVLAIDASVSAYTSASSSNINPFDGKKLADPYVASSGASRQDVWSSYMVTYTHSSNDRNEIWSAKTSFSAEFDYYSLGIGGSFTKLFNQKNTELSLNANVFFDTWELLYPVELRGPESAGGDDDDDHPFNINSYTITGNPNYTPSFTPFSSKARNSYSVGFAFSQILSKKLQGSVVLDFVKQNGLLSTPFQRIYFSDVADSFIENFHLADDVERLPNSRLKIATGGRINYYINEYLVLRTFYRYYSDDWGINSHTASLDIPIKFWNKYTIYPSYRYYNQTATYYFAPYNQHLISNKFYTSDYDLSGYYANQFSLGFTYTDIFSSSKIWKFGLKSFDLKFIHYYRNSNFRANILTASVKIILD
jgi:hypothetical protein